jgi:phosphoglycerate dehydrogenase-like enzyme
MCPFPRASASGAEYARIKTEEAGMPNPRIFIFAPADAKTHKTFEDVGAEIVLGSATWANPTGDTKDEFLSMAAHADALLGTSIKGTRIDKDVMMASENLRIIAKYTVGVDEIDVEDATEMGIVVTHAPTEANWGGVVESTMTMMLTLLKKTRLRDSFLKTGQGWRDPVLSATYIGRREDGYPGKTIGIVGLGRIGSRFSEFMKPWRVRLIAYDPYVADDHFAELGVDRVDYDTLLRESDVVTFHVILTRETRHMLGARELGLMKPTAVIINNSRGPVIDEPELIKALQEERIAGAALDVFEKEPIAPDNPLLAMDDRVFVTPHVAANNDGAGLAPGILWGTADVMHALRGEVPEHVFNPEVLPRWRERWEGRSAI